jgi:SAM-dependent methyltransferase
MIMTGAEHIATWERDEQAPFAGWDFTYLAGRAHTEGPPSAYPTRAAVLLNQARAALDLDTGGGEQLLALCSHWPPRLAATEGYPPNLRLATERLVPLGVAVVAVESSERAQLPFPDASVDVVLNRHGGCLPMGEIARVLRPGGTLLTQQVHGQTLIDLLAHFGARPQWPEATPAYYLPRLAAAGLELVALEEYAGAEVFADVGAVVYFLKAIPWLVPGFSVRTHLAPLLALQARRDHGEALRFATRGYRIEARKPAA